jgi:hypothetical protein
MPPSLLAQQSLFPVADSLEDVVAEGITRLPITTQNELVALLYLQQNTLIHLLATQDTELNQ